MMYNQFGHPMFSYLCSKRDNSKNNIKCVSCKWMTGLDTDKTGKPCPISQTGADYGIPEGCEAKKQKRDVTVYGYPYAWVVKEDAYCPLYTAEDENRYTAENPYISIWHQ